jgi:hypothetical protein
MDFLHISFQCSEKSPNCRGDNIHQSSKGDTWEWLKKVLPKHKTLCWRYTFLCVLLKPKQMLWDDFFRAKIFLSDCTDCVSMAYWELHSTYTSKCNKHKRISTQADFCLNLNWMFHLKKGWFWVGKRDLPNYTPESRHQTANNEALEHECPIATG